MLLITTVTGNADGDANWSLESTDLVLYSIGGGAYIVMDQQTGRPINLFDFCQQIKEVYCGQLTNNCARLL